MGTRRERRVASAEAHFTGAEYPGESPLLLFGSLELEIARANSGSRNRKAFFEIGFGSAKLASVCTARIDRPAIRSFLERGLAATSPYHSGCQAIPEAALENSSDFTGGIGREEPARLAIFRGRSAEAFQRQGCCGDYDLG